MDLRSQMILTCNLVFLRIHQWDTAITSRRCLGWLTIRTYRDSRSYQAKKIISKPCSIKLTTHPLRQTIKPLLSSNKTTQLVAPWSSSTQWTKWLLRNKPHMPSNPRGTKTLATKIRTLSSIKKFQIQAAWQKTLKTWRWIWNLSRLKDRSIHICSRWQVARIQALRRISSRLADLLRIIVKITNSYSLDLRKDMMNTIWGGEVKTRLRNLSSEMTEDCVKLEISMTIVINVSLF